MSSFKVLSLILLFSPFTPHSSIISIDSVDGIHRMLVLITASNNIQHQMLSICKQIISLWHQHTHTRSVTICARGYPPVETCWSVNSKAGAAKENGQKLIGRESWNTIKSVQKRLSNNCLISMKPYTSSFSSNLDPFWLRNRKCIFFAFFAYFEELQKSVNRKCPLCYLEKVQIKLLSSSSVKQKVWVREHWKRKANVTLESKFLTDYNQNSS